jgi:glycerophosphoryl diester phosphodiesterase
LPINPVVSATDSTFPRVRVVGHRGNLFEELENTRPGFLSCIGICDAVELDVFLLKDGSMVIFHGTGNHDDRPGLLAGYIDNANDVKAGATSILDLTLEETQQLKFSVNYAGLPAPAAKVQQAKIPTLEQVLLDLRPTGMEVKIELKGPGTARPVLELVDRLQMVDQVSFSSFQLNEIETVRRLKPERYPDGGYVYRTGALFSEVPGDYLEKARAVGASTVHLRYDECTTDRVRDIHDAGMGSMCWTPGPIAIKNDSERKYWDVGNEDEPFLATVMATGVQQFCTNRPKLLHDVLRRRAMNTLASQSVDVTAAALA